MKISLLANPARFRRICTIALPVCLILSALLTAVGLYLALIHSPPDYQQKDSVRIMYIHVPAAWMAIFIYSNMGISSVIYLVWKHAVAFIVARESAIIGACFTLICLVTGSIWGKPMWGVYWAWDARLTSMLLMLFIYLAYIFICRMEGSNDRTSTTASVFCIVGMINLPVIRFSVEWWNTLHQPASVIRDGGIAIAPQMQAPLFTMALAFLMIYLALLSKSVLLVLENKKNQGRNVKTPLER